MANVLAAGRVAFAPQLHSRIAATGQPTKRSARVLLTESSCMSSGRVHTLDRMAQSYSGPVKVGWNLPIEGGIRNNLRYAYQELRINELRYQGARWQHGTIHAGHGRL
jgi:hypothetical protein